MLEPDTYRNMFETDKLISSYKKLSELILTKVISSYTNITCIFQDLLLCLAFLVNKIGVQEY